MRKWTQVVRCLIGMWVLMCLAFSTPVWADVAPGDVITKDNWEKIQGLVPDPVLNWIKKGDVLEIGEIPYKPGEYLPPGVRDSLVPNLGKYEVNAEGVIVDSKTGKDPGFITGLPFPKIDPNEPNVGFKIMHNKNYYTYATGCINVPFQVTWIGRSTGKEREIDCQYLTYVLDGEPSQKNRPNPDNIEMNSIIRILAPFDVRGTNVLLLRYRDNRADSNFTYVPSIRRVRRMSPANRSDAFLGTDFCVDDAWGYAGKVNAFEWKIIRKEDQVVPFFPKDPIPLTKTDKPGEWKTVNAGNWQPILGIDKPGYTGSPWFPTNFTWIKRPTYVMECKAKDPYYNYGTQYLWVDAEFYQPTWKVIHDRANSYWKVEWQCQAAFESPDKQVRLLGLGAMIATDDRSDHSCFLWLVHPRNSTVYWEDQDINNYSLAGFQALCK